MTPPTSGYLGPLSTVDRSLAIPLREAMAPLAGEIIAAIRTSVPEYAQPLEGSFGRGVRTGVSEALSRFADMVASPQANEPEEWRRVYFNLGGGELRQGRTLESLLAAYRVGARVAWRRIAEAASAAGASPADLTALAEAIFAYIDEISAISAEGYAAEQATAAGETQRRRERLVRMLIEGEPMEAVAAMAEQAAWKLPRRAAALVATAERAPSLAARLGAGTIARPLADDDICAIVPDPGAPGRAPQLRAALAGATAAIGPAVEPAELQRSYERARLAHRLARQGVLAGASPIDAGDHLAELVVHTDPALLAEHAERQLAPLGELTAAASERLLETLRAWLDHPGQPTAVARAVHVHPQTARYRLRRLRELLGDIDDPERRFELTLALRARPQAAARRASS